MHTFFEVVINFVFLFTTLAFPFEHVEDRVFLRAGYAFMTIEKWMGNGAVGHAIIFDASLIVFVDQVIDRLRTQNPILA